MSSYPTISQFIKGFSFIWVFYLFVLLGYNIELMLMVQNHLCVNGEKIGPERGRGANLNLPMYSTKQLGRYWEVEHRSIWQQPLLKILETVY